ncbi:MAG: phospholipid carrier-dependent glycosyltransferase [Candidatus Anstonellales archaeon]
MVSELKKHVALLLIVFLLSRATFVAYNRPLIKDEALYARMVDEFLEKPRIIPTYFGQEVAWRPVVPFLLSAPFVVASKAIIGLLDVEIDLGLPYRLSSLFFGACSVVLIYLMFRREFSADFALCTSLMFMLSFSSLYADTSALVDSVLLFFVLSSLACYFHGKSDPRFYILGGILSAFAYWTKTVVAFIIPIVAVAYAFERKGELRKFEFLISLFFLPLSLFVYDALFEEREAIIGEYLYNIPSKIFGSWWSTGGIDFEIFKRFVGGLGEFIINSNVLVVSSIIGLCKFWKRRIWLATWMSLLPLVFFVGVGYFWYPLPLMPAVCAFSSSLIFNRLGGKFDRFSLLIILTSMAVLMISSLMVLTSGFVDEYAAEREAGLFLAGKEKVLVIGNYVPTVVAYKMMADGLPKPCIVYIYNSSYREEPYIWKSNIYGFDNKTNYTYNFHVYRAFWDERNMKIPCGYSEFDWVLTAEKPDWIEVEGYELVNRFGQNLSVYKKKSAK